MGKFKGTYRNSDGTEKPLATGTIEEIISQFRAVEWPKSTHEIGYGSTFPEFIVTNLANGDSLNLQALGADCFQCSAILTIPNKFWGLDIWIFRETWESKEIELSADRVIEAIQAFGRSDSVELKSIWSAAA